MVGHKQKIIYMYINKVVPIIASVKKVKQGMILSTRKVVSAVKASIHTTFFRYLCSVQHLTSDSSCYRDDRSKTTVRYSSNSFNRRKMWFGSPRDDRRLMSRARRRRLIYWGEPERAPYWSNGVPRDVYM